MKNHINETVIKTIIKVIVIIIMVSYALFLYMDFFNEEVFIISKNLKYTCIILCFFIAILSGKNPINNKDIRLLQLGLFLTVLADLCLVIFDYNTLGIVFFSLVQITYSIRHSLYKGVKAIVIPFIITFQIVVIIYFWVNIKYKIDMLFFVAFFYAICLSVSLYRAVKACSKKLYPIPNRYMIALGMLLFFLCDINVGLYNIVELLKPKSILLIKISEISLFLIWFFYLPSQLLLSLSGYRYKN